MLWNSVRFHASEIVLNWAGAQKIPLQPHVIACSFGSCHNGFSVIHRSWFKSSASPPLCSFGCGSGGDGGSGSGGSSGSGYSDPILTYFLPHLTIRRFFLLSCPNFRYRTRMIYRLRSPSEKKPVKSRIQSVFFASNSFQNSLFTLVGIRA